MQSELIELLSPAKDLETGIAAINCGADAVYIGASHFGARESAGNQIMDIEKLARYAHLYRAKVFVTMNTLLFDEELQPAENLAHQLYQAGVDALIIQDYGLLELNLPPLPLFASTQMHNHTVERVAFLEKAGFTRVILARELSIQQIQEIKSQTSIQLEAFIHGALCVSYSGECYMSYALGGRSGNRGQCAQPCRRRYRLLDKNGNLLAKDKYLLSLRDQNQSINLIEMLNAGITSFKIEGRLKDKAYVMNVVAYYRQILDAIYSNHSQWQASSSGIPFYDFTPNLHKTFNRGFTTYFLHGRGEQITSPDSPKSTGESIGVVKSITQKSFVLEVNSLQLNAGDGICFYNHQRTLCGTQINHVDGKHIFPDKLPGITKGTQIFRNHDHQFIHALNNSKTQRKIGIVFTIETIPEGIKLTAEDEDNFFVSQICKEDFPPAEKPQQMLAAIEKQLSKTGNTIFFCKQVVHYLHPTPFITFSAINSLRNQVLEQLNLLRSAQQQTTPPPVPNSTPYPRKKLSYQDNVLNQNAEKFFRRHGVEQIEPAVESNRVDLRGRPVMVTKLCLRSEMNACLLNENGKKLTEPLTLIDENGNQFDLHFNCSDCQMEIIFKGCPES